MGKLIDLTGQKFGSYVVTARAPNAATGQAVWEVQCDCGYTTTKRGANLRQGDQTQCRMCKGRQHAAKVTKHGGAYTKLYRKWADMRHRCEDPTSALARNYYHKGIRVCDEWQDFAAFREWALRNGYKPDLSIERKDSDRGYEPGNCEWIPMAENARRATVARHAKARLRKEIENGCTTG